ncbi:histidine kinase [Candidatus Magnetomoraceae bacterium gMMP-13]
MKDTENYILIVDDSSENIQVINYFLKRNDYNVAAASDGQQALNMIAERKPELILLDVTMPIMDGFETCKKIKANPETKDIPVIFITAKAEPRDIVKGFKIGAADYVSKPLNFSELFVRINMQLKLKRSKDIIMRQNHEQKELLHVLCHDLATPFNVIKSLTTLLNDCKDAELINELMKDLNRSSEQGIDIINLVRKMRALQEGDFEITECDLKTALYESKFMLTDKFTEKNITCEIFINDDESLNVYAENTSLVNSIINNLLTNAIKFSFPDSKIIIRVEKENDKVLLSIKDFGIGMPQGLLNDIFDLNKATSRPGTNGEMGTGFGMPLIKKFIDAYSGKIEIKSFDYEESPDNHGTEIKITLRAVNN